MRMAQIKQILSSKSMFNTAEEIMGDDFEDWSEEEIEEFKKAIDNEK